MLKIKNPMSFLRKGVSSEGGDIKGLAIFTIYFICGLFFGYCITCILETRFMSIALAADMETAQNVSTRSPSFANGDFSDSSSADEFEKANPFRADRQTGNNAVQNDASGINPSGNLQNVANLRLKGTLPGIGAWIERSGKTRLILLNQKIDRFTLTDVKYYVATLTGDNKNYTLPLLLSGGTKAPAPAAKPRNTNRKAVTKPTLKPQPKDELDFSGLEPASEGQEGAVPRELVDALLMNPYDELAKVRMIPTDSGMRLERLAEDSIWARVGVAQGDVVSAINGVNITNVGDASNALNSLMTGSRFDVTVIRGGKQVELKYQVK